MEFMVIELEEGQEGMNLLNTVRYSLKAWEVEIDRQIAMTPTSSPKYNAWAAEADRVSEIRKQLLKQLEAWGSEDAE